MIYIALGANVPSPAGPPEQTLRAALEALPRHGITVLKVSRFFRSQAWPDPSQPPYVNGAAQVASRLEPGALLRALLAVEREFGRVRKLKWEPRTLDLDLLDYGGLVFDDPFLSLPHPALHERDFVLVPLAEIAPAWRHPVTGQGTGELLAALPPGGLLEPLS